MNQKEFLFAAIKSQFPWAEAPLSCREEISQELIRSSYDLAVKQDLGHFVASAAECLAEDRLKKELAKQKMIAVFRREQISFEEKKIFALLDENEIDYIPLKGSVIKDYYPEEWMRTSSDSDVLVRPQDGEKALALLKEKLGYRCECESTKDFLLSSPNGVHVELQFSLESGNEKNDKVTSQIWNYTTRSKEDSFRYDLAPEFIIFYVVAHAIKHFRCGGCGIKPFLDVWVLNHQMEYDPIVLNQLLETSEIKRFYDVFSALSEVWFCGMEHTALTRKMEDYIFHGGVYGNRENYGKVSAHRQGGRAKYMLYRIFKSKKELMRQYPSLEKHPLMLPFYQIRRWFNLFDKERRNDVNQELKGGLKTGETEILFEQLGI